MVVIHRPNLGGDLTRKKQSEDLMVGQKAFNRCSQASLGHEICRQILVRVAITVGADHPVLFTAQALAQDLQDAETIKKVFADPRSSSLPPITATADASKPRTTSSLRESCHQHESLQSTPSGTSVLCPEYSDVLRSVRWLKFAELSRIGVVEPCLISVGLARRFPGICVVYAQVDATVLRPDGRRWVVQFPDA